MSSASDWDLPEPFFIEVTVGGEAIDSYGHVNNTVYIGWLEQCAWAHSAAMGFSEEKCLEIERGHGRPQAVTWSIWQPAIEGDRIRVGNWLVANDGRLRATRRFQLINETRCRGGHARRSAVRVHESRHRSPCTDAAGISRCVSARCAGSECVECLCRIRGQQGQSECRQHQQLRVAIHPRSPKAKKDDRLYASEFCGLY